MSMSSGHSSRSREFSEEFPESEKGTDVLEQCETCDETHDATHVCITCGEEMCACAAEGHCKPRPCRDHQVVTIEEFKGSPKAREAAIYCPEHKEPYKFFDEDCDKVVCLHCVTLEHREHKCTTLSKAAAKYRDQMGVLAQQATTQARDMREAEDNVRAVGEQLDETRNDVEGEIRNSFAQMRTALDAREAELLNDLATHHKAKSFILTDQRDRLRTFQACLESAVHRLNSSINGPGDAQLLVARNDVVSTLEAMQHHQPDLQPLTNSVLRYANQAPNVQAVIANGGVVGEIDPDLSWMDTTDQAQGFRKLAGTRIAFAVSKLTNFGDRTTYDVPLGYRWATVDEAKAELVKATADEHAYLDQAGWIAYIWNGKTRLAFYVRDSVEKRLTQHVGHRVKSHPMRQAPEPNSFAGLVCIRE